MKIRQYELYVFLQEYYGTSPQNLRLGQAFWNKYLTHETQKEDKLFYEPSNKKAKQIIIDNYVDWEEQADETL